MHLHPWEGMPLKRECRTRPFCLSFPQAQQTSPFLALSVLATSNFECTYISLGQGERKWQILEEIPTMNSSELDSACDGSKETAPAALTLANHQPFC